jgi:hypothetical protein
MTTGRFPFFGGSVGSFVNQISPRCGFVADALNIQGLVLLPSEMVSGELAPDFLFLHFSVADTVVIAADGGFECRQSALSHFLSKKFIQNRRL